MAAKSEQGLSSESQVLETVDLPESFGPKIQGKVRDNWVLPDGRRVIVTTDRQSAFDRIVCLTPGKGRQLNMLSAFWFVQTADIFPNHMLVELHPTPHPNVMICIDCQPIPVEMVLRDYVTGSTPTSLWKNYSERTGVYDWLELPENLRKNQKLPQVVITPTTKAEKGQHDEPISPVEANRRFGRVYREMEEASRALFERGAYMYRQAGLILVDTKFEFGYDRRGNLTLIDELFTPDCSRIWRAESYEKRMSRGKEPDGLDKEFLRLWLKDQGFSGEGEVPPVPSEVTGRLADLYAEPYRRLTGIDLSGVDSSPQAIRAAILRAI